MARSKGPDEIQKANLHPGKARSGGKKGVTSKKGPGPARPSHGSSTASARSGKRGVISVPRSRPLPRTSGPSLRLQPAPAVPEAASTAKRAATASVPTPAKVDKLDKSDKKSARLAKIRALAERERQPPPARVKTTRASARLKMVALDDPDDPAPEAQQDPQAESPTHAPEPEATIAPVHLALSIAEVEDDALPAQAVIALAEPEADVTPLWNPENTPDLLPGSSSSPPEADRPAWEPQGETTATVPTQLVQPTMLIAEIEASTVPTQPEFGFAEPEANTTLFQPAVEIPEHEAIITLAEPSTVVDEPEATIMGAQPAFEILEPETNLHLAQAATMEASPPEDDRLTRSVLRPPPHNTLADLLVTMRPQTPPVPPPRPKKTGPGKWLLSKLGQLAETFLSSPRRPRRGTW